MWRTERMPWISDTTPWRRAITQMKYRNVMPNRSGPELSEPIFRFETKPGGSESRMTEHPTNDPAELSLSAPALTRLVFVAALHARVTLTAAQAGRDRPCRTHSRVQGMPHPFSAKRVDHARGVADGEEVRRQPVIADRPGDKAAVLPFQKTAQRILINKEARIGACAFNGHRPAIPLVEEAEVEDVPSWASRPACTLLVELHAKLWNGPAFRESAQF